MKLKKGNNKSHFFYFGLCLILLSSCFPIKHLSSYGIYYRTTILRKSKIIDVYTYYHYPKSNLIQFREGNIFERYDACNLLVSNYYVGTYKVENDRIIFFYLNNHKPEKEFEYAKYENNSIVFKVVEGVDTNQIYFNKK